MLNIKTLGGFPLNDSAFEFHLEPEAVGTWRLYPFHASPRFTAERAERQPGEPTATRWSFSNPDETQPLQFRPQLTGAGGSVPRLATGSHAIAFDCRFSGDPAPRVEVTFKTRGVPERASIVRR